MVKGIIYNPNVEDLAKEPEVTIVPGVTIGEHDREYFYRDEKIDWENLKEIGTNFENIKFL